MSDEFELPSLRLPAAKKTLAARRKIEVAPFRIVIDTREQLPYRFDNLGVIVPTLTAALHSGDYSILGFEDRIAIERKSLTDLYGSCTRGRDRFEREIQRLEELEEEALCLDLNCGCQGFHSSFAAVVIEATWHEVENPMLLDPAWENQTRPESILGTITAWSIRYPRVHWWCCGERRDCEKQIYRTFKAFWKVATPR